APAWIAPAVVRGRNHVCRPLREQSCAPPPLAAAHAGGPRVRRAAVARDSSRPRAAAPCGLRSLGELRRRADPAGSGTPHPTRRGGVDLRNQPRGRRVRGGPRSPGHRVRPRGLRPLAVDAAIDFRNMIGTALSDCSKVYAPRLSSSHLYTFTVFTN